MHTQRLSPLSRLSLSSPLSSPLSLLSSLISPSSPGAAKGRPGWSGAQGSRVGAQGPTQERSGDTGKIRSALLASSGRAESSIHPPLGTANTPASSFGSFTAAASDRARAAPCDAPGPHAPAATDQIPNGSNGKAGTRSPPSPGVGQHAASLRHSPAATRSHASNWSNAHAHAAPRELVMAPMAPTAMYADHQPSEVAQIVGLRAVGALYT
ncbi:hypothetical protein T484DRAFT_1856138 [Baffinella frigidus]|nr:hypothetical protein T484DRAFT_1856138 [Cryptophyta sp. CCMP2293]